MKLDKREALKHYCLLIHNRLNEPIKKPAINITEVHHIIPRCICKFKFITESKYNLIRLYAHEHFLAHYYLSIIFPDNIGVQQAFYLMSNLKKIKTFQNIEKFAYAYEVSKFKVLSNRKNKTYNEMYGKENANLIKIKQKKSKLSQMTRILVDK